MVKDREDADFIVLDLVDEDVGIAGQDEFARACSIRKGLSEPR